MLPEQRVEHVDVNSAKVILALCALRPTGTFWIALSGIWDLDLSACRGLMCCQGPQAFCHESHLRSASAHQLSNHVSVEVGKRERATQRFDAYEAQVNDSELPKWGSTERVGRIGWC